MDHKHGRSTAKAASVGLGAGACHVVDSTLDTRHTRHTAASAAFPLSLVANDVPIQALRTQDARHVEQAMSGNAHYVNFSTSLSGKIRGVRRSEAKVTLCEPTGGDLPGRQKIRAARLDLDRVARRRTWTSPPFSRSATGSLVETVRRRVRVVGGRERPRVVLSVL